VFDNVSKFLAARYSADFATWLLGRRIDLTTLNPTELNVEPIRADSIVLLSSSELILHTEFQTEPDKDMPLRMADYYIRLRRRFPTKSIEQVVIYLHATGSELVRQSAYITPKMNHQFRVIQLWEEPVENFISIPGLLPYAVLAQTSDRERVLERVVVELERVPSRQERNNLIAAAGIFAGLELSQDIIRRIIRSDVMRESVIYQEILQEGRIEGRVEGRTEEGQTLVLRQLNRKIGNLNTELTARVNSLSIDRVESLGEALLDFSQMSDLVVWLDANR
jgi:predicted transposase/invertase (TIGR01784 family)